MHLRLAAASLLLLGAAVPASAAGAESGINVSPVQLHLSGKSASALLTVSNGEDRTVRFQVDVAAWRQDEHGEMQLSPAKDVVFFPQFLVLEPKTAGKVRVGLPEGAKAEHQAWRIVLEEMPPSEAETQPGTVAVRTKMSVPVFLDPADPKTSGDVSATVKAGVATLEVRNTGNVFVVPKALKLRGLAADGSTVFERGFQGWYLLPGDRRVWTAEIPKKDCVKIAALVAEAALDEKAPLSKRQEIAKPSCGH